GYDGADADRIALSTANIALQPLDLKIGGGIDGITHAPDGSLLPGVNLRAELTSNPAVHHNDLSQGAEHPGEFHFRNLLASPTTLTYQIVSYWQPGNYETQLVPGISVSPTVNTVLAGPITMSAVNTGADPYNGA